MSDDCHASSYGWNTAHPLDSHSYIAPAILSVIKSLGSTRILDLGCGNGALSHYLQVNGFQVVGCDADPEGISIARTGKSGAVFSELSIYDRPERLGQHDFDVVVSTEVVEHLYQPSALVTFARSVLRPGGHLVLSTPYHGYFKNLLISLINGWDRHHDPLWEGGHIKFWSRQTIAELLRRGGFQVIDFRGVGRGPLLWKSMIVVSTLNSQSCD